MKKLSTVLLALMMAVSGVTFAQNTGAAKAKPAKTTQAAPKEKAPEAKPATAAGPLKKDGTPDKRYKENKHVKSDGTPDKRYKENKATAAPAK
ncbi:hypothetical protein [Taibaiella chishuiensis]|uniref:Uncharacterized protein n=1 Tax=Taibaiella chishuiensis TaxID=1434707 RepID=A0A2P8D4Q3_9BACT|nr:hypothetical protein [Taibaiella chishuiensis]PSK92201.1 hypothetical protein B0I18_104299 [Taibaiella chishuiensis]